MEKNKTLVKVKLGLPTNKTKNKEDLIVDKDIRSLEHTRWRCQYHVVFAMVFSITHRCVNFIATTIKSKKAIADRHERLIRRYMLRLKRLVYKLHF